MTHDEAIAAGYKDEMCPKCGTLFAAQIHFIRCDAEPCPMKSTRIRARCFNALLMEISDMKKSRMMDETGNRYGRLTVLGKSHGNGPTYWTCRCDCGNERVVDGGALRGGRTKSCGCLNSELSSQRAMERNITHGHNAPGSTGISPTYSTWQAMIQRCTINQSINIPTFFS
jgi:hypothetical protein